MNKQTLVDTLRGARLSEDDYRSQESLDKVAEVLAADEIDLQDLKTRILSCGVPSAQRSTVWKLLLGYLPPARSQWDETVRAKRASYKAKAAAYNESIEKGTIEKKKVLKDISVDIPRSYIEGYQQVCYDEGIRKIVKRLLYIWASNDAIGYYQGMMDLLYAVLIVNMTEGMENREITDLGEFAGKVGGEEKFAELMENVEADTFYCFDGLMKFWVYFYNSFSLNQTNIFLFYCLECIWR